jgi:hypothetical protein
VTRAVLAVAMTFVMSGDRPRSDAPLWPGARFTRGDRDRAIQRGMVYLYNFSKVPKNFRTYGHDLVGMFANIAATSDDETLRDMAAAMGRERAIEWRRLNPHVPAGASADGVSNLVTGSDAAEFLGVPGRQLWIELREASARYNAVDYYGFDVVHEPPPDDLSQQHSCGKMNARGVRICARCGKPVVMRSRYDVWQDAMIGTFTADRYGLAMGAHFRDALQWLPSMRPWRGRRDNPDFEDMVYAVTHLVYTLNDYSLHRLPADRYPEEFAFLKANLHEAIALNDPEMLGEFMDSLRSFGLTLADPLLQTAVDYLLSHQNADGSWDDVNWPDIYGRYHPTWTVIDGLREYRFR